MLFTREIIGVIARRMICAVSSCETCRQFFKDDDVFTIEKGCPETTTGNIVDLEQQALHFIMDMYEKVKGTNTDWDSMTEDEIYKLFIGE